MGAEVSVLDVDRRDIRTEHDLFEFDDDMYLDDDEESEEEDVENLVLPETHSDIANPARDSGRRRSSLRGNVTLSFRKALGSLQKSARRVIGGNSDGEQSPQRADEHVLDLLQSQTSSRSVAERSESKGRLSGMRESIARGRVQSHSVSSAKASGTEARATIHEKVETTVFSWGRRDVGQVLDHAKPQPRIAPSPIKSIKGSSGIVSISTSMNHTVAITSDGAVYGSGDNMEGQLQSDREAEYFKKAPKRITDPAIMDKKIVEAACGMYHTVLMSSDGHVFGCGQNGLGQLGRKEQSLDRLPPRIMLPQHHAIQVACAENSTFILTSQGMVFSCGFAGQGVLGLGDLEERSEPTKIGGLLEGVPICHISAGAMHAVAVSVTGRVYSWGRNRHGQLGIPTTRYTFTSTPVSVDYFNMSSSKRSLKLRRADENRKSLSRQDGQAGPVAAALVRIRSVACGENHTAFVSSRGVLFTCGKGSGGQLGIDLSKTPNVEEVTPPEAVVKLPGRVSRVACGDNHTMVLLRNGLVFAFGENPEGVLGVRSNADSKSARGESHKRRSKSRERRNSGSKSRERKNSGVESKRTSIHNSHSQGRGSKHRGKHHLSDKHTVKLSENEQNGKPHESPESNHSSEDSEIVWLPRQVRKLDGAVVLSLSAGGQTSFAITDVVVPGAASGASGPLEPPPHASPAQKVIRSRVLSYRPVARMSYSVVEQLALPGQDSKRRSKFELADLKSVLQTSLFEVTTLNASFLSNPIDPRFVATRVGKKPRVGASGLDVAQVLKTFDLVAKIGKEKSKEGQFISKNLGQLISKLVSIAPLIRTADQLRAYLLVFLIPTLGTDMPNLFAEMVKAVIFLPIDARSTLFGWVERDLPSSLFMPLFLRPTLSLLTPLVTRRSFNAPCVLLCRFLHQLYLVNERVAERKNSAIVPYTTFCITETKFFRDEDLGSDYAQWRAVHGGHTILTRPEAMTLRLPFFILDYPFLFAAETKRRLMQFEDNYSMTRNFVQSMFSGQLPFLQLVVKRQSLLQDTMLQLMRASENQLRTPLRVKFDGEEGLDAGGVKKEFFLLLSDQLFNPDYGMFTIIEETQQIWFNRTSALISMTEFGGGSVLDQQYIEFMLVGIMIGLAIFNDTLLNVNFPQLVYRWMLGQKSQVSLRTLETIDPSLAKGLKQMLDYKGDDFEDVFSQTFEVTHKVFDDVVAEPLKPGGGDIPVTRDNVKEYVNLYVKYVLSDSVKGMANAMIHGFNKVVLPSSPPLKLFRPEELELLVTGSQELDFVALEKATTYEGGFSSSSSTVRHFWTVLRGMSEEEKAKFLQFSTGSKRAPVGGLSSTHFHFKVQRAGPDSNQLPTAHTCFNTIMLPDYKNLEKLRAKLSVAINNSLGFGLE